MTTRQFAATPKDGSGTTVIGRPKVWDIGSGPATIDQNGLATATGAAGIAVIGCTVDGVRGTTTWNLQGVSTAADSIAALVTALGGNGVVPGIYDTRIGRTVASGRLTALQDARGSSGFGPTLLKTNDNPGYEAYFDANTLEIYGDGSTDPGGNVPGLASPAFAGFNLGTGDKTLVVIAKAQEPVRAVTTPLAGITSAGSSLLRLDNQYSGGSPTSIRIIPTSSGNVAIPSGIAPSAIRRVIYATSRAASGGTAEVGVLSHAAGTAVTDIAQANSDGILKLLGGSPYNSSESRIVFAMVVNGALSSGQKTAIANFATAQWGVTLAS